jgi:predicted TPR repeat methyltransferase
MLREPDNPVPRHLYAACSGEGVPERASDRYVEAEFDTFAPASNAC